MSYTIHHGDVLDVLRSMPDESVHCVVTSPPYWGLRDYGVEGQIGLEPTPDAFVAKMVEVFAEVRRVLRADGTCWINLGDSYASVSSGSAQSGLKALSDIYSPRKNPRANHAYQDGAAGFVKRGVPGGLKPKDLIGIPWRVALALQSDGWWLRSDIIWAKRNCMPESVTDRPTKAHEYVFLMAKAEKYFYDAEAIKEPASPDTHARYARGRSESHKYADGGPGKQTIARSLEHMTRAPGVNPKAAMNATGAAVKDIVSARNKRTVWDLSTMPTPDAHFATFPIELPETCILAGCPADGVVLDPFCGSGTTGLAALKHGRRFVGIELNQSYIQIAYDRLNRHYPLLASACQEPDQVPSVCSPAVLPLSDIDGIAS